MLCTDGCIHLHIIRNNIGSTSAPCDHRMKADKILFLKRFPLYIQSMESQNCRILGINSPLGSCCRMRCPSRIGNHLVDKTIAAGIAQDQLFSRLSMMPDGNIHIIQCSCADQFTFSSAVAVSVSAS